MYIYIYIYIYIEMHELKCECDVTQLLFISSNQSDPRCWTQNDWFVYFHTANHLHVMHRWVWWPILQMLSDTESTTISVFDMNHNLLYLLWRNSGQKYAYKQIKSNLKFKSRAPHTIQSVAKQLHEDNQENNRINDAKLWKKFNFSWKAAL